MDLCQNLIFGRKQRSDMTQRPNNDRRAVGAVQPPRQEQEEHASLPHILFLTT